MTIDRDYLITSVIDQLIVELDDSGLSREEFEEIIKTAVETEIDVWLEEGDEFDYQLAEENIIFSARNALGL